MRMPRPATRTSSSDAIPRSCYAIPLSIDRHPPLIVGCAGVANVIAAMTFARDHDLLPAVRRGRHNGAGNLVCDAGPMLEFSLMKGIRIDPVARTA